jgi:hypothetical protein
VRVSESTAREEFREEICTENKAFCAITEELSAFKAVAAAVAMACEAMDATSELFSDISSVVSPMSCVEVLAACAW